MLCNPNLVKTGLNLIGWASIVVLEPVYSLYTLAQAVRRAYRPTQTQPCEVVYMCYAGTMSETAMGLVAEKMAALALLSGDEITDGFASVGQGSSLMSQLAKLVTESEGDVVNQDIRAMLAANAQAVQVTMRSGASDLLGVDADCLAPPLVLDQAATSLPSGTPPPIDPTPARPVAPELQPRARAGTVTVRFGDLAAIKTLRQTRKRTPWAPQPVSSTASPTHTTHPAEQVQLALF